MEILTDSNGTRYVNLPGMAHGRRNVKEIAGRRWVDVCPLGSGEYLALPGMVDRVTVDGGGTYFTAWRIGAADGLAHRVDRFDSLEAAAEALAPVRHTVTIRIPGSRWSYAEEDPEVAEVMACMALLVGFYLAGGRHRLKSGAPVVGF